MIDTIAVINEKTISKIIYFRKNLHYYVLFSRSLDILLKYLYNMTIKKNVIKQNKYSC